MTVKTDKTSLPAAPNSRELRDIRERLKTTREEHGELQAQRQELLPSLQQAFRKSAPEYQPLRNQYDDLEAQIERVNIQVRDLRLQETAEIEKLEPPIKAELQSAYAEALGQYVDVLQAAITAQAALDAVRAHGVEILGNRHGLPTLPPLALAHQLMIVSQQLDSF